MNVYLGANAKAQAICFALCLAAGLVGGIFALLFLRKANPIERAICLPARLSAVRFISPSNLSCREIYRCTERWRFLSERQSFLFPFSNSKKLLKNEKAIRKTRKIHKTQSKEKTLILSNNRLFSQHSFFCAYDKDEINAPKSVTPNQKELYVKLLKLKRDGKDVSNPIAEFADNEKLTKLSHEERQRYILNLCADYMLAKRLVDEKLERDQQA